MWIDLLLNIRCSRLSEHPQREWSKFKEETRNDRSVPFVGFQGDHKAKHSIYNLIFHPGYFYFSRRIISRRADRGKQKGERTTFDRIVRFKDLRLATTIVSQKIFTPTNYSLLYFLFLYIFQLLAHIITWRDCAIPFIFMNTKVEEQTHKHAFESLSNQIRIEWFFVPSTKVHE